MTRAEGDTTAWGRMTLAQQFALAGGVVMLLATVVVGLFVTGRIEEVVVRNTANATALYMESFISPLSQELAFQDNLAEADHAALDRILVETPLGRRVVSFKIWIKGAKVIQSSDQSIEGKTFEPTENLIKAWAGEVRADFNSLSDLEDEGEADLGVPLLEVYSPIRAKGTGEIIGIAEFYENATQLETDLIRARLTSWTAVALVMAAIWGLLFVIVLRGSRTIERQFVDLSDMAARNVSLRLKVQSAAGRFSALNDQALRRIGADLHDGPAQLMGFAALRLDALRKAAILAAGPSFRHDLARVKRDDHILVTGGVYRFVRHPAYLGFTLWTLGLQLALANPLCALALTAACLRFFAARVRAEERLLVSFFGARYGAYRGATRTWLPGVG